MGKGFEPLDPNGLTTVSVADRPAKVEEKALAKPLAAGATVAGFLDSLPGILAAKDLLEVAEAVAAARRNERPVIVGLGGHVIKTGLSPLLVDAMESGIVTGLAMNGSCIVHDFEMAYAGNTSEDVAEALDTGMFGVTRETGEYLNGAVSRCKTEEIGLGRAVGEMIVSRELSHRRLSVLGVAAELEVPATVHVAVGTDIIHMHPGADGAAIGLGSYRDFLRFAGQVAELEGGVYINLGSAVILPEVFLKALAMARNLGRRVDRLVTVNMDFLQHYRPRVNVVSRPTAKGGRGYALTGHHEIMFPLLLAAVKERLGGLD